ncbi:MAG: TonB-dependent receptor, partial [Burkholderiaceae bacterium]
APEGARPTSNGRSVQAVYGELLMPVTKALEVQAAARLDHYEGVGSTANPKLGLRYAPEKTWLLRASAGRGFRAPSLNDLYRPTVFSTTSTLVDPVCMSNLSPGANTSDCADNWSTRRYSNAKLKPERSSQLSLGWVYEPNDTWRMSLDYWSIRRSNLISEIGDDVILSNLAKHGALVHRYNDAQPAEGCDFDASDASICYIEMRKENRGQQRVSGVDVDVAIRRIRTSYGDWGVRLNGTLTLESKVQTAPGDAFISNLGRFVTDGAVQRWRHRLTVDYTRGPWNVALSNNYLSGYTDQNSALDNTPDNFAVVRFNRVKAYSLWDLSARWQSNDRLTVRAGVKNLFNTAPPFSNQAYFFISGYDPSYTDPRGRSYFLHLQYQLK